MCVDVSKTVWSVRGDRGRREGAERKREVRADVSRRRKVCQL